MASGVCQGLLLPVFGGRRVLGGGFFVLDEGEVAAWGAKLLVNLLEGVFSLALSSGPDQVAEGPHHGAEMAPTGQVMGHEAAKQEDADNNHAKVLGPHGKDEHKG